MTRIVRQKTSAKLCLGVAIVVSFILNQRCEKNPTESTNPIIVKDIDGNTYNTVKVGKQLWMSENLKVIHYRNGDLIPCVIDSSIWNHLTSGAYCTYNNDEINVGIYGRLYNWYTVDDNRKLAPAGWHVPSEEEFQVLVDNLGGKDKAGAKLKETGTAHWKTTNDGATNESGFTALPGGLRSENDEFYQIGIMAIFWSSTNWSYTHASGLALLNSYSGVLQGGYTKQMGFSVRCIKD